MANWYVRSAAAGAGTGADWTNAFTTLTAAIAAAAAGDVFFVADDHAQTQASALTLTFPGTIASPNKVYSVDHTAPTPGGANLLAGARVATTGNNAMTVNGSAEFFGIRFAVADGVNLPHLTLCATAGRQVYRTCIFDFTNTTGSQACFIGVNTSETPTEVLWTDSCQFLTGSAAQAVVPRNTSFTVENCPTLLTAGANGSRNFLGAITTETTAVIKISNCDFSNVAAGGGMMTQRLASDRITLENCKLGTYVIYHASTPDQLTNSGAVVLAARCESVSGVNYGYRKYMDQGSMLQTALVTRTGGASDGTTPHAIQIQTSAEASWMLPFETIPFPAMNNLVGSALTITVEGISNTAAIPQNDEIWVEVGALTNVNDTIGSMARSARANGLTTPANYTASSEVWGATAAARANTTAYTLGQAIKLASNPGRVFFCTTAGTSAGSEPAGFASAVDGGSVTDGSAVFRAGWRFKMAATITPQQAGPLSVRVKVGEPSATYVIDPKFVVT